MALLPQSNARLLSVVRESGTGAFTEDYDRPAVNPNTPIWQGNLDAYVQRKQVSIFNDNGQLNRVMRVTLFIGADLPVTLTEGDVVTYQAGNPDAPSTLSGRIQNITNPAYMPTLPDYYKLALEEVPAP